MKMVLLLILLSTFLIFSVSVSASSLSIAPNNFQGYKIFSQTGAEKELYGVSINGSNICLNIQEQNTIIDGKAYNATTKLPIKDKDNNNIGNLDPKVSLCYTPIDLKYSHLGNESIILQGTSTYNSIDDGVQQEDGFAHLQINQSLNPYDKLIFSFGFNINTSPYTFDYSSNNQDGLLNLNPVWLSDQGIDNSGTYNFTGTNSQNIQINNSAGYNDYTTNFTMGGWFRREKDGSWDGLISKLKFNGGTNYTGWNINFDGPTDKFCVGLGAGINATLRLICQDAAGNPNDFSWHFLAINSLNNNFTFWEDGKMQDGSLIYPIKDSTSNIVLGQYYSDTQTQPLNGFEDNIFYFNTSLTEVQMNRTMARVSPRYNEPGTQKFKNLDLGTNTTLNVSFANYYNPNNTRVEIEFQNDSLEGGFVNLTLSGTGANATLYDISSFSNKTNLTLTLHYISDLNLFYTPVVQGNITIDASGTSLTAPNVTINDTGLEWIKFQW